MKTPSRGKRIFRSLNLDLFFVEKLNKGLILLKVYVANITYKEIDMFIETIELLRKEGHNDLIIDFSNTESLDQYSFKILIDRIIEISTSGGSIRLLVTEDNPKLPFSIGMAISKLNVYLNLKSALLDFNINKKAANI